ncbi:MAG: ribosomal protein S18-alanine N-acetyltransferase [Azoarcus sp.]|jgi:ribosomal-protein-alanine N-acetyltransferase|nr:ribosomal protein S18-alanine N-acetyltransferase [Azoarcus sp.]
MTARSLRFVPMDEQDLGWVVAQEASLHRFPWSLQNFTDSLAAGYSCWLMRDADTPIGYAVVLFVLDEAHLLNISVAREAQGRGLGGQLLGYLISLARNSGVRQFFLEVRPSNLSALALYQRAGFMEIARRKGYYPSKEGREDAIVMRLEP